MKCAVCETEAKSKFGLPYGWFTLKDPGEVIVCSAECMNVAYDEFSRDAAEAAAAWKAGK